MRTPRLSSLPDHTAVNEAGQRITQPAWLAAISGKHRYASRLKVSSIQTRFAAAGSIDEPSVAPSVYAFNHGRSNAGALIKRSLVAACNCRTSGLLLAVMRRRYRAVGGDVSSMAERANPLR